MGGSHNPTVKDLADQLAKRQTEMSNLALQMKTMASKSDLQNLMTKDDLETAFLKFMGKQHNNTEGEGTRGSTSTLNQEEGSGGGGGNMNTNTPPFGNRESNTNNRVPKIDFPRGSGDNPKTWVLKCDRFLLNHTMESQKVMMASMHLEGIHMPLVDERLVRSGDVSNLPQILAYELVQGALVKWSSNVENLKPDIPTAVLLHGILGGRKNWGFFARRLAQEFPMWQFLLVDLRCHGDSTSIMKRGPNNVASAALDV